MKKNVIFILVAFAAASVLPVFAQQTSQEKVICELAAKNCLNQVEILQKRIKKLDADIKKGTKTYSPEELKKLEKKLQETRELLDKLEGSSAAK